MFLDLALSFNKGIVSLDIRNVKVSHSPPSLPLPYDTLNAVWEALLSLKHDTVLEIHVTSSKSNPVNSDDYGILIVTWKFDSRGGFHRPCCLF